MLKDTDIGDLTFVPARVARDLGAINVRTARQMFHRLQSDRAELREYLRLDAAVLERIEGELRSVIERDYPHELIPAVTPVISKSGVAADRPRKPKYYDADEIYVPPARRRS